MIKNTLKKIRSYIFAGNENFTLEHRILLSAIVVGILVSIIGGIINFILGPSLVAVIIPFILSVTLITLYYFVRFKKIFKPFVTPIIIIAIFGISIVWIFNGGINGSNIMPAFIILILGIIVAPDKNKKYIIILFIAVNIFILLLQFYKPDLITDFPSDKDRWIDNIITLIYCSYFIYIIISFIHKNYTLERRRAEKSERRATALLNANPDMIFRLDREGTYLDYKADSTEYYDQGEASITGKKVRDIAPPEFADLVDLYIKQTLDSGELQEFEYQMISPKRGLRDYEARMVVSSIDEVITVVRDITERKQAEEEILLKNEQLSKLNSDKDRFISILGHDLRNPFSNLLGLSDILTKNIHSYDIDKIENLVSNINKSAQRSFNLLNDLLNWANAQQGNIPFKPQNLSLTDVCNDVLLTLSPTANEKNIEIHSLADEHFHVFADTDMLRTILRNLVSNAIKFTYTGGTIRIYAEQEKSKVTISVSDNGIGITADNHAKIFDITEFFTTKGTDGETGTGLGLILCKEFVNKHGGTIWVESEEGKGSDFKFTLPMNTGG